jgi:phosphohistidine phosphatase
MKRLILVRHAKSSWNHPDLRDIDRPLNKRGLEVAPLMGAVLNKRGYFPEAILISPSVRTRMTAGLISAELGFSEEEIQVVDSFYGASPGDVVHHARKLSDEIETAMLVGHNPTWTSLCDRLTGEFLDNLPTAGVLIIDFPVTQWCDLEKGTLTDILIPRDYGYGGGQA